MCLTECVLLTLFVQEHSVPHDVSRRGPIPQFYPTALAAIISPIYSCSSEHDALQTRRPATYYSSTRSNESLSAKDHRGC